MSKPEAQARRLSPAQKRALRGIAPKGRAEYGGRMATVRSLYHRGLFACPLNGGLTDQGREVLAILEREA